MSSVFYHKYPTNKVFIGVPCYNNQETICKTLESLRLQTFEDFCVVISDDSSSDDSAILIEKWIQQDEQFQLVRQAERLGLYQKFSFLHHISQSPYFMWLAADDFIRSDFLEANVNFLERNHTYSASCDTPYYIFCKEKILGNIFELTGNEIQRMRNFLNGAKWSHSILYSLMRKSVIDSFRYLGKSYAAADWNIDLHLILNGKINTLNTSEIYFGTSGLSRGVNANRKFVNSSMDEFFPLLQFTIIACKQVRDKMGYFYIPWRFFIKLNFGEIRRDVKNAISSITRWEVRCFNR